MNVIGTLIIVSFANGLFSGNWMDFVRIAQIILCSITAVAMAQDSVIIVPWRCLIVTFAMEMIRIALNVLTIIILMKESI